MAPEQRTKKAITSKIDIWAFGICVIEMAEAITPIV